jgi:hypothetical protein
MRRALGWTNLPGFFDSDLEIEAVADFPDDLCLQIPAGQCP